MWGYTWTDSDCYLNPTPENSGRLPEILLVKTTQTNFQARYLNLNQIRKFPENIFFWKCLKNAKIASIFTLKTAGLPEIFRCNMTIERDIYRQNHLASKLPREMQQWTCKTMWSIYLTRLQILYKTRNFSRKHCSGNNGNKIKIPKATAHASSLYQWQCRFMVQFEYNSLQEYASAYSMSST